MSSRAAHPRRYAAPPRLAVVGAEAGVRDADVDGVEQDVHVCVLPDGSPMTLRGTAAVIFRAAHQGAELEQIVAELTLRYAAPRQRIAADVAGFLEQLVAAGVLVPAPTPDRSSEQW